MLWFVLFQVTDEDGQPLSAVLLSLSAGQFRSNNLTLENGSMVFANLVSTLVMQIFLWRLHRVLKIARKQVYEHVHYFSCLGNHLEQSVTEGKQSQRDLGLLPTFNWKCSLLLVSFCLVGPWTILFPSDVKGIHLHASFAGQYGTFIFSSWLDVGKVFLSVWRSSSGKRCSCISVRNWNKTRLFLLSHSDSRYQNHTATPWRGTRWFSNAREESYMEGLHFPRGVQAFIFVFDVKNLVFNFEVVYYFRLS